MLLFVCLKNKLTKKIMKKNTIYSSHAQTFFLNHFHKGKKKYYQKSSENMFNLPKLLEKMKTDEKIFF